MCDVRYAMFIPGTSHFALQTSYIARQNYATISIDTKNIINPNIWEI